MTNPHSEIRLFMRLEPDIPKLTHQNGIKSRVLNGHSQTYKTPELRNLEVKYISLLKPYAPQKPWACPIALTTIWYFRAPASRTSSDGRTAFVQEWKTTKPDTENMIKTLKDCMTRCGFWRDDAVVCLETIGKFIVSADCPHGISIRISDLTDK